MGFESKVDAERCVSLRWPALGLTLYDGNTRLIHLACSRLPQRRGSHGPPSSASGQRHRSMLQSYVSRLRPIVAVMWKGQAGYAPHNPIGQDSTVDGETFAKPRPCFLSNFKKNSHNVRERSLLSGGTFATISDVLVVERTVIHLPLASIPADLQQMTRRDLMRIDGDRKASGFLHPVRVDANQC